MDNRLNEYLQKLEAALGDLEAEQRTNELREMRQHIEAMVARQIERGQSSDEALTEALAQFGPPQQVGRALCAARVGDSSGRVLTAVLGAVVVNAWLGGLASLLFGAAQSLLGWGAWLILPLMIVGASFGAGTFAGFMAPYRGKRAIVMTYGLIGVTSFLLLPSVKLGTPLPAPVILALLISLMVQIISAWQGASFGARCKRQRSLKHA